MFGSSRRPRRNTGMTVGVVFGMTVGVVTYAYSE